MKRKLSFEEKKFALYVFNTWENKKRTLGLTQVIASKELDITQASFSQFITGKVPMPIPFIFELSVLLMEPLFKEHPTLKKQLDNLNKIKIQEVQVPVMFALNTERPVKSSVVLCLPDTASQSSYAVHVNDESIHPYATLDQYMVVDPLAKIKIADMVLVHARNGTNYVGNLIVITDDEIQIKHPITNSITSIKNLKINFTHKIVGVFSV